MGTGNAILDFAEDYGEKRGRVSQKKKLPVRCYRTISMYLTLSNILA